MKEVKPHTSSVSRCWRGLWICMSKSSVRLHWFHPTEKLKGNKNPVGLYHNLLKLIHMISVVVMFPNWGCDSWISGKNMADRKNNEPLAVGEVSKSFYGRFFSCETVKNSSQPLSLGCTKVRTTNLQACRERLFDIQKPGPIRKTWPSSNLPLFLLEPPPPLLAALRWTPVHNKKLHM